MVLQSNIINLHTVDAKKWVQDPNNIYIGRTTRDLSGSKWASPFPITNTTNRTKAIHLFKKYLQNNEILKGSLHELKGKTLGCWCAPQQCHAELLHHRAGNTPQYSTNNTAIRCGTERLSIEKRVERKTMSGEPKMKNFTIKNVGEVTKEELTSLFGLTLSENTLVEVISDESGNHAKISLLEKSHQELLLLRNVHFKGCDLIITYDDEGMETNKPTDTAETKKRRGR